MTLKAKVKVTVIYSTKQAYNSAVLGVRTLKPRCGGGGGGDGGGGSAWWKVIAIYGIVRMCVPNGPLFQRCQVYDWPPFFNKK